MASDGSRLHVAALEQVFHLPGLRHLVAGLVLGQDLHEGAQLQPPLLFGDPVPAGRRVQLVRLPKSL